MEKAVFVASARHLPGIDQAYDRLYFGIEFCERLIPTLEQLKQALAFARSRNLAFSLVTPYLTDSGLNKLKPLLGALDQRKSGDEVVINDWGVFNLLDREYPALIPVLGRLLTKQKRCPRLSRLLKRKAMFALISASGESKNKRLVFQKKLPLELDPYYKGSNVSSVPVIHSFLSKNRINRIELDNLAQGLHLELPEGKLRASVYFPYAYISTTFFCLSAGCDDPNPGFLKLRPCQKQCQKYLFTLKHKSMPKTIYLKGNTQFYKFSRFPLKQLQVLGVDRIVYQPNIPI